LFAVFRPAAAVPLAIHIHSDRAMFQVLISPGTVRPDNFAGVALEDQAGGRFRPAR
jgi:hypothetical protein